MREKDVIAHIKALKLEEVGDLIAQLQAELALLPPEPPPSAHPVVAREEELRLAMLAGDADALDGLIDDRLMFVGPDGEIADKATDLALHRSGRVRFTRLDYEREPHASGDGGVVWVERTARATVIVEGQESAVELEYLRIWAEDAEGWRVVAGHVRVIGAPAAPAVEPDWPRLEADIRERIEALYTLFARYAPTWPMDIADTRDPERIRAMEEKPLRELTANDLGYYAFCAVTTMGSGEDLKYFFPRIAELLLREPVGAAQWDFLAEKLGPYLVGEELDALRGVYHAVWRAVTQDWWARYRATAREVLRGAAHLGMDLAAFGAVFEPCERPASARWMAECVSHFAGSRERGGRSAIQPVRRWECESLRRVGDWLARDETLAALLRSQHRFPAPDFDEEWSTARSALRDLVALRRTGRSPT